jgi:hypothetical protein
MTWVHYRTWNPHAWPAWPTEPISCASSIMVSCVPDTPTPEPEIRLAGDIVRFSYIQSGDRRFALRKELLPSLKQEGALWSCEFDDLHLMGYGYSLEQAMRRFMDDFAVAYDGLVGEADDHLTADARQLRDALSYLVVQVTPVEYGLDVDLQRRRASTVPGMCMCATQ